jgi:hypothetical protein
MSGTGVPAGTTMCGRRLRSTPNPYSSAGVEADHRSRREQQEERPQFVYKGRFTDAAQQGAARHAVQCPRLDRVLDASPTPAARSQLRVPYGIHPGSVPRTRRPHHLTRPDLWITRSPVDNPGSAPAAPRLR